MMKIFVDNLNIREYQHPDDYQAVSDVWKKAGKGIHITFSDSKDEIAKYIRRSPGLFLVADFQNTVIGTVMGGFDGRRGLVYHLAVLPEYQKNKIGSTLLENVEKKLKLLGCTKLYLMIMPNNLDLIEYYQRQGYETMDVKTLTKFL